MTQILRLAFVASASIASLNGCGTILNVKDRYVPPPPAGQISIKQAGHLPAEKLIYGGTLCDAMFGTGMLVHEYNNDPMAIPVGLYTLLVDLPMSALGDTLTLPFTIPAAYQRDSQEFQAPTQPPIDEKP
ncbi:MAG: hypothetical protein WD648_00840 [Planctomycetaceae bacterium]